VFHYLFFLPFHCFMNSPCGEVAAITRTCGLAAVQLHGDEDNHYLGKLRSLLPQGTLLIKAFRVQNREVLAGVGDIACDLLLLDAYKDSLAGGTGEVFDWKLLQGFPRPYILAGGLNTDNLRTAVEICRPYGVDVSSGVETGGFKDREKIRDFVQTARRYSNEY